MHLMNFSFLSKIRTRELTKLHSPQILQFLDFSKRFEMSKMSHFISSWLSYIEIISQNKRISKVTLYQKNKTDWTLTGAATVYFFLIFSIHYIFKIFEISWKSHSQHTRTEPKVWSRLPCCDFKKMTETFLTEGPGNHIWTIILRKIF